MKKCTGDIVVRSCRSQEDLALCVDLQRRVWGYSDIDVVPTSLMVAAQHTGGHVYGAFNGAELVGTALGIAARRNGRQYIHSHRVGVTPEYQNQGVGGILKLYQREQALASGINLIEWTFDPLQIRNAYFNIRRLGATMRRFLPNCYGITSSPLHGKFPTDRLVAEWWLNSPHVEATLSSRASPSVGSHSEEVSVPANIEDLKRTDPAGVLDLQQVIRSRFLELFAAGFVVVSLSVDEEKARYFLEVDKNTPG